MLHRQLWHRIAGVHYGLDRFWNGLRNWTVNRERAQSAIGYTRSGDDLVVINDMPKLENLSVEQMKLRMQMHSAVLEVLGGMLAESFSSGQLRKIRPDGTGVKIRVRPRAKKSGGEV